ncbi:DNA polymerase III epsilon subunit [Candidatus Photodesmus blepharus]|uniref:DNA polymerase III epsilon subunit n=1 Tax=Candidatus Photodesmus blepharonis TaxID=1179155 RepID=A0A084CMJ2_9GAMM|nr:3'-5' exonuclease [Candidatus Photodesmus blepharus]KEY91021.1 DNA polymerase III epsilon subunit [Candidatus Photodesmus blepharus]
MIKKLPQFPIERLSEILNRPKNFKLLERIPLTYNEQRWPLQLSKSVGDDLPIIILDVETTGLSVINESIIELAMVKAKYSPSEKRIVSILDVMSMYEDPGKPIPSFITELTGITDKIVQGKHIDDILIANWLDDYPLIVAHNAQFDRPFFEKRFNSLTNYRWACSATGIDWQTLGFQGRKLEYLLLQLGWFYEGHRAITDSLALTWLLYSLPQSVENLLYEANCKTVLIRAIGAPFNVKEQLKKRGYRWHNSAVNKYWWREINEQVLSEEKIFLDNLYDCGSKYADYDYKDATERFKI